MASPGPWAQLPLPGISVCRPAGQTKHISRIIYINCGIYIADTNLIWASCLQYINWMLFWIRNYSSLGWLGCSLQTTLATFHCPNLVTSVYIHPVTGWIGVLVMTWSRDMVWCNLTHCTKSALSRIKRLLYYQFQFHNIASVAHTHPHTHTNTHTHTHIHTPTPTPTPTPTLTYQRKSAPP